MGDSDVVPENAWGSLLSDSDLNSEVFEATKRYPCKFEDCKRSFTHSQSRSRHYRQDHSSNLPPTKDTTVNFNSDRVTVNLTKRTHSDFNLIKSLIPSTPEIADVINLCQSFFNQENIETAIVLIKGSRIVQENAIEMRNAVESLFNSKIEESKTHQEKIRTVSQRLKEQMILANATQKHKAFEAVLALVFESDRRSIEYLSTFHSVFGMALQHSKMFSERVNVDMKRTRLLKRALNEIVDEDNRMHKFSDFSEKRRRSAGSPSPVNVFLGSSDDERTEPTRRLNNIMSRVSTEEEEVDIARNAMKTARHTLRQPVSNNDADNDYDFECTERMLVYDTEIVRGKVAPYPVARPADDLLQFDAPAPHHTAAACESPSHHGVVGYSDSSAPLADAPRADRPPVLPVYELQLDRSPLSVFLVDSSTSGESSAMDTDSREQGGSAVQMIPVHRQQPPGNTWASQVMGFLSPSEPVQLSDI